MLEPESSEKYAAMSQRYIEQADEEFEKGDLGQASNKAWGAAALALKSIAERRGWNHNKHGLLYDISGQMADELGQPDLRIMFRSANAMHQNYYEDWMAVDEVRDGIEDRQELTCGSWRRRRIQRRRGSWRRRRSRRRGCGG